MSFSPSYSLRYPEKTVEDYVNFRFRDSKFEMERVIGTISMIPREVETVLDIGAGYGVFLEELNKTKGIKGVGVEIAEDRIDFARSRGIDMVRGTASELEFPTGSFDLVTGMEVLEHLPWQIYERALTEISRVSRKFVIITVPNNEEIKYANCPYCGSSINPNYHLRSFSERKLRNLFSEYFLSEFRVFGMQNSPMLTSGYWQRNTSWRDSLLCPVCGFQKGASFPSDDSFLPKMKRIVKKLSSALMKAFPCLRVPYWMAGLFTSKRFPGTDDCYRKESNICGG